MGCRKFQVILMQVARGEAVEYEARQRAVVHSYRCEACSSHLTRSQILTEALMTLSAANRPLAAPVAVEENLLEAVRKASRQGFWQQHKSQKLFLTAALAAAAAVILVVWVAGLHRAQKRWESSPARPAIAAAPLAKAGRAPVSTAARSVAHLRQHPVTSAHRKREAVIHRNEALQGFLPLPNADDSDGGTLAVVRIEIQPGDLEALGITDPEGNNGRPVVADVLIGNDGMASAIRFDQ